MRSGKLGSAGNANGLFRPTSNTSKHHLAKFGIGRQHLQFFDPVKLDPTIVDDQIFAFFGGSDGIDSLAFQGFPVF